MLDSDEVAVERTPIKMIANGACPTTHSANDKNDTNGTVEIAIKKSENDNRSYRYITLRNKLRVLLVSDPQTYTAAACLAVAVGSFSDPDGIPGLAHFCEHMILLGSKKHPEENGYANFVTSHSGGVNAFTTSTETCYFFDVAPAYLGESLERFADLFESPLFTASGTEREVSRV